MTLPGTDSFLQRLRHSDYFVRDHRVHGVCTLPGVVLLDMVYRLSSSHLRTSSIELRDVLFTQPIVTSSDFDVDIILTLSMNRNEEQGRIIIHSRKVRKDNQPPLPEVLNMECKLYILRGQTPAQSIRTLPNTESETVQRWDMDQIYQLARQADIQHFSFMKNQGEVYRQDDSEWMDIRLSDLAEQSLDQFHAHVALLDGATFAGSSFRLGDAEDPNVEVPPYIPFMIERFVIYDRFPAEIRTFTERTDSDVTGGDIISRNIAVTDRKGRLLAEFVSLKAKRVRHAAAITGLTEASPAGGDHNLTTEATFAASSQGTKEKEFSPAAQEKEQVRAHISFYLKTEIARMLQISPEAVDDRSGFYEQGLDSMHLLDLVKRLETRVRTSLYPTLLFEHSSVQALTDYLENHCPDVWLEAAAVSAENHLNSHSQSSKGNQENSAMLSETSAMEKAIEVNGEPVCYEPKWIDSQPVWEMASTEDTLQQVQPIWTHENLYRVVVLYGNYPNLAARLVGQPGVDEVFHLPGDSAMNAELYRQKINALYGFIQKLAIHGKHEDRPVILQVLSDSSDKEGYIHGLEGLLRTAAMELPKLSAQLIKMDLAEGSIDDTVLRLLQFEAENIPAGSVVSLWYKGISNKRYVRKLVEMNVPQAASEQPYTHGGVYLITGGMGGLGYALAAHLSRQSMCKLVLIGRSPLDERIRNRLIPLYRDGTEVEYIQVDLTNQDELEQAVRQIRETHGEITGIFHCAGTTKDEFILQKSLIELDQVLKPKMDGIWNLEQAFRDLTPEFIVAFSSLSAIVGNKGQADYAAANSCMDMLLLNHNGKEFRNGKVTRTYTINWPLWADGGMQVDERIRNRMYASSGSIPLPLDEGMALLDRIIAQKTAQVVLLYGEKSRIQSALGNEMAIHLPPPSDPGDIAVIGMAGRYPSANHVNELARILKEGRDSITRIPDERWNGQHIPYSASEYCPAGGFLDRIDDFDPGFFNISPLQAEMMDPQARLFLQTAWAACEDAGFAIDRDRDHYASAGKRSVGVFAGVFWNHYELHGAAMTQRGTPLALGSNASAIANLVSYHLNFHGPSLAVDSMCSSSLTAIHLACESIRYGQSQYAIAGGVNLVTHPHKYVFLKQAKFLSSDGKCRSFGKDGDGYVPGEGVGAVLLTTVAEARKQGFPVYGVIKGSALNHAGKTSGTTVPDPVAQAEVITDALTAAGVQPGSIGYIEAHGTGTSLGDPIEIQGLERAFRSNSNTGRSCAVGSLKSNIGHLEAAAGVAGLTKLMLQLKHSELFPSLHASELNPLIPFEDTCFHVQQTGQSWERRHGTIGGRNVELPVRAGLSSFGASGSNAHLIVEEYIAPASPWKRSFTFTRDFGGVDMEAVWDAEVVIPISAKTQERLLEYARLLHRYLENENIAERLSDIAYTFQVGRMDMKHRVAFRGKSRNELMEQIHQFLNGHFSLKPPYNNDQSIEMTAFEDRSWEQRLGEKAILWEKGETVDWASLYVGLQAKPAIVRVPTYPFARNRYWIQDAGIMRNETAREEVVRPDAAETSSLDETTNNNVQDTQNVFVPLIKSDPTVSYQEDDRGNQIRTLLTRTVSSLLKVSVVDLDVNADWVEFGFDSILFTELADRLNQTHGLGLTPAVFFEHNTIHELASHLLQEHADMWGQPPAVTTYQSNSPNDPADILSVSSGRERNMLSESCADRQASPETIAIVGISAKFPMADDVEQFWENLLEGKDCISEVPEERWSWQEYMGDPLRENGKTNVKHAGFMNGISEFDPLFFGISPKEAAHMDPQQRLLMMHVWKVIEDAGYAPSDLSGSAMGLFIGTGSSGYNVMMAQSDETIEAYSVTATVPSVGPNRMSYVLNIHGPSQPVETSCSSSLVAIHRAVQAIQNGECDTAVAGGVNTILSVDAHISLSKAGMLSADGRCKTFSSEANGYGRGEGVGMIFLKRLSDAERDHDHIYGLIRGSGENHGGRAGSLTSPNPKAQTALLNSVYTRAGIDPSTISYIEAHGTGTPLGDPIEINALKAAFKERRTGSSPAEPFSVKEHSNASCGIGSVKTNIGHLELASGIAGVIKVLLQMKHRKLVPSLHAEVLNPYLQLEHSPFYVVRQTQDWKNPIGADGRELPRRAGVSAFGFGGSNAHIILEEYISPHNEEISAESECAPVAIVLSAKSKDRLREQMSQLSAALHRYEDTPDQLQRIACTLQTGRQAMEYRAGFIASSLAELQSVLDGYVQDSELWTDTPDVVCAQQVLEAQDNRRLYLSCITANRRTAALFSDDEELKEAIRKWLTRRKYNQLLELWVQGVEVRWELLYGKHRPERIALPTYPFVSEKYWVGKSHTLKKDSLAANAAVTESADNVDMKEKNGLTPSVEDKVRSIMSSLLGVEPKATDEHRSLEDYGMDSVLALQLLHHLQTGISTEIRMEELNECLTLQDVIRLSLNKTSLQEQKIMVTRHP